MKEGTYGVLGVSKKLPHEFTGSREDLTKGLRGGVKLGLGVPRGGTGTVRRVPRTQRLDRRDETSTTNEQVQVWREICLSRNSRPIIVDLTVGGRVWGPNPI